MLAGHGEALHDGRVNDGVDQVLQTGLLRKRASGSYEGKVDLMNSGPARTI